MTENTSGVGSRTAASSPERNGDDVDLSDIDSLFPRRDSVNGRALGDDAVEPKDRPTPGIGGEYAAEHGRARGVLNDAGYATVAAIRYIAPEEAISAGLIDSVPTIREILAWYHARGQVWFPPLRAKPGHADTLAAARIGFDGTKVVALATLADLAAEGVAWAKRAVMKIENDYLDNTVKFADKRPSMTVSDLHSRFGAPIDELSDDTRLPPMDDDARRASLRRLRNLPKAEAQRSDEPRKPLAEVIRHVADMAHDEPTGTIMDGLIYEQMVIHWIGDGGTFKTFTVLSLSCAVAAGRDFTHQLRVPAKQSVLYLCAERRHYGLGADVLAWCKTNKVDISDLELFGWDNVVQLADDDWMRELTEFVIERGIKLIVFDTQRKSTHGIEENSSTDIGAALGNAAKLAKAANAAVIVIHHTTRGQDHAR